MSGRALRIAVAIGAMLFLLCAYWFALPLVRGTMLPSADPAHGLLWIIGPARSLRFGAATILSAVTLPVLVIPLRPFFRAVPAPMPRNTPALLVQAALLAVVYGLGAAFYFTAYVEVADRSITFHGPLGPRSYRYDQVVALEHQAPVGGQPDRYAMHFDDDRWGYFDADHEGIDAATVVTIATHVSERVGRPWFEGGTR